MKTVLVTGASGYLAHRLIPILATEAHIIGTAATSTSVVSPARFQPLDITDSHAVDKVIDELRPDAIVHAAACNPGGDDTSMEQVNHLGTLHVARAAARINCRLVTISTDIVHNGRNAPYADEATVDPINRYGETKARGEAAVALYCPDAITVRTSLIYGLDLMDRGTQGFLDMIKSDQPLTLFNDVIRQPVWVDSLATAISALALHDVAHSGLINIAGKQALSRAEFALKLLQFWDIDLPETVGERSAADLPGVPLDVRLSLTRAEALGYALPGVDEVLASYRLQ